MYAIVITLTVIVAVLLIIVVLIQKSKGGGLASGFSSANQIMGVRHTNDFVEKATWTLAAVIGILAIISVYVMPTDVAQDGSRVKLNAPAQTEGTQYATEAPSEAAPVNAKAAPAQGAEAPAETPAAAPGE